MKKPDRFSLLRGVGLTCVGAAALVGLDSCNEEEAKTEPAAQPVAEAPAASSTEKKDALFQELLYGIGKDYTAAAAANPAWVEPVRNHLVLLQEYYDEMAPANAGKMDRAKLAVRVAQVFSDLTSFEKSVAAFNTAMEDFNALGDEDKDSTEGRRLLSAIYTGLGSGLISQGKVADALPNYEKALETDLKTLTDILPEDKMPLPNGEVDPAISVAAADVISSYNCLAFCQRVSDDPEEARQTLRKCQDLVKKIDKLSPAMSLSYVRLLTTLGDLESACGNLKEAMNAWVGAASICQQLYKQVGDAAVRAEASLKFRQLAAAVRAVQEQLGETPDESVPAEMPEEGAPAEGEAPAAN